MGATFSRVKTWVNGETLSHTDLNAEFDNILNNLDPAGVDDYSASVANMQTTADPYPGASPSQATSLQGELQRIRYLIAQITGETYWYIDPDATIAGLVAGTTAVNKADSLLANGSYRTATNVPAANNIPVLDSNGSFSIGSGGIIAVNIASNSDWTQYHTSGRTNTLVSAPAGGSTLALGANLLYGGTPADYRYIASAAARMLIITNTGDAPFFYTAASGTAGNAATLAAFRVNLTSGTTAVFTKIVAITNWDMDTNATFSVAHGLTSTKIVTVDGWISTSTADTTRYPITPQAASAAASSCSILSWDGTNVNLQRVAASMFDAAAYNSADGQLVITYTE